MFDSALAMQNLILAAHALGLGTVIIGKFDTKEAEKLLGVPSGFRVVTMTPLGYLAENPLPRPRLDTSALVSFDKFELSV